MSTYVIYSMHFTYFLYIPVLGIVIGVELGVVKATSRGQSAPRQWM